MGPKNPILISISFLQCLTTSVLWWNAILNDKISSLTWLPIGMCIGPIGELGTPNHPDKKSSTFLHLLQPGFRSMFAVSHRIFFSSRIQWYLQDAALEGKIFTVSWCFFFDPIKNCLQKKNDGLNWNDMEEKEIKNTIDMIHPGQ